MLEGWRKRGAASRYGIIGAALGLLTAVVLNFAALKSVLFALVLYPLAGGVAGFVGARFWLRKDQHDGDEGR
ncbi:MAG: hypothetical protein AAFX81_03040 [Pseudomonadota bacterium]